MRYNNRSKKGQFQKKVQQKAPTWSIHGVDGKFQPIAKSFCTNSFDNLELFNELIPFCKKVILQQWGGEEFNCSKMNFPHPQISRSTSPIRIKFGVPTTENDSFIHLPGSGLGSGLESVGLYPNMVKNINDFRVLKNLLQHCNQNFKNENLKLFNHISMLIYFGKDICIKCLLQSDHSTHSNCEMGKHHDYLDNSKNNTQTQHTKVI